MFLYYFLSMCEYEIRIGTKCVTECVRLHPDLLGLRSRHSHNAADALSDGLLRDDDKRRGVARVLQMAANNKEATAHYQKLYSCGRQLRGTEEEQEHR